MNDFMTLLSEAWDSIPLVLICLVILPMWLSWMCVLPSSGKTRIHNTDTPLDMPSVFQSILDRQTIHQPSEKSSPSTEEILVTRYHLTVTFADGSRKESYCGTLSLVVQMALHYLMTGSSTSLLIEKCWDG